MTDTDRLVVWLRDAMAAAWQLAEAAARETSSADWEYQEHDNRLVATIPPWFTVADVDYLDPTPGKFMAATDPAAVLRRISADRKILDWHTTPHTSDAEYCVECGGPCTHKGEAECTACGMTPCNTLVWLAEGYGRKETQ